MCHLQIFQYQGFDVDFEMIDGCIYANASAMCKPFNRRINDWASLATTVRYVNALRAKPEITVPLSISRLGGAGGGAQVWIHEKLILKLAQWLDVDFEIWCDEQIALLLKQNQQGIALHSYQIDDPIQRAEMWIREQKEKQALLFENAELKPKAEYAEKVLLSSSTLTTTKIAQDLGMTAQKLNKILETKGVQYRQSGMWNLTRKYNGKGYAKLSTFHHPGRDGTDRTEHNLVWTEAGREFINALLNPSLSADYQLAQSATA